MKTKNKMRDIIKNRLNKLISERDELIAQIKDYTPKNSFGIISDLNKLNEVSIRIEECHHLLEKCKENINNNYVNV